MRTKSVLLLALVLMFASVGAMFIPTAPAEANSFSHHHREWHTKKPRPTTTPTPTTTTTTPPPAGVCTNPVWSSSTSNDGTSFGQYYVHNNMWNAANYPGTTQTVDACSAQSWNVTTTANNNANDGAVKTYPNVHQDFDEPPLPAVLKSTYAATSPHVGIYNVAYDIWLNGIGTPGNTELMIWTDNFNQVPAGSKVGTMTFSGVVWDEYVTGDNGYIALVPPAPVTSGSLDLRAIIDELISQGRINPNPLLTQVCYGVEIVSTNGQPAKFNFTDFSLTTS